MPQLDLSTYSQQIFWFFVLFGLFYFLIAKFLLPGIQSNIEYRENHVSENLRKAKDIEFANRQLESEIANIESKIHIDSKKILDEYAEKIHKLTQEKKQEIELRYVNSSKQTIQELELFKNELLSNNQIINHLASIIVEKITNKDMSVETITDIRSKHN